MPREPIKSFDRVTGLPATYDTAHTYELPGLLDKLDVVISSGDAVLQFRPVARDEWLPDDGITLKAGLAQSLTGISKVHEADGGVDAFRLKRGAGVADSTADVLRAWLR